MRNCVVVAAEMWLGKHKQCPFMQLTVSAPFAEGCSGCTIIGMHMRGLGGITFSAASQRSPFHIQSHPMFPGSRALRYLFLYLSGSRHSVLVERRTRGLKAASSNPGRSAGRIFFSRVNFVC